MTTEEIQYVQVDSRDLLDAVNLASVPLEEDAPAEPKVYLNMIRNLLWPYLTNDQRTRNVDFTADKEYLPPVNLILDK
tara:strand:- start:587 stop:820 length:234 start_codon:yes stop_codon:yes gene_type:complete